MGTAMRRAAMGDIAVMIQPGGKPVRRLEGDPDGDPVDAAGMVGGTEDEGVGTGGVRMRAFRDPEEFLLSLRTAEILRRPKSLAYLQGLKWVAQAKERVR